jgi:hypothetical protein
MDSAPACTSKTGQRNSAFGGLAAIFAGLEFVGLLNQQRYAAKRPGIASH